MTELKNEEFFLGVEINQTWRTALDQLDQRLLTLMTQGGNELAWHRRGEKEYLGKFVSAPLSLPSLQLLNANIFSLLRRLAPHRTPSSDELLLIIATER